VIADSNVIIARLITLFAASVDIKLLTPEQRAIAHAATRMVEEHLAQTGFYYRYGLHMPEFYDVLSVEDRLFNGLPRGRGWRAYQPAATLKIIAARRLASPQGHSDEELWGFANDDLAALEALLGGRDFFFGAHASALDCAVFGQLIQFMDIPMSFPQQSFLKQHCPNLILFVWSASALPTGPTGRQSARSSQSDPRCRQQRRQSMQSRLRASKRMHRPKQEGGAPPCFAARALRSGSYFSPQSPRGSSYQAGWWQCLLCRRSA